MKIRTRNRELEGLRVQWHIAELQLQFAPLSWLKTDVTFTSGTCSHALSRETRAGGAGPHCVGGRGPAPKGYLGERQGALRTRGRSIVLSFGEEILPGLGQECELGQLAVVRVTAGVSGSRLVKLGKAW